MELEALRTVEELALKKQKIYKRSKWVYLFRAMLASAFIGFGVLVAFRTGNFFYAVDSPFAYPSAAFAFGAAILLIAYGGGDLFTGNTFYFTYSSLKKKMKWSIVLKMLTLTFIGNLVGAVVFAICIYYTNLLKGEALNGFLLVVVEKKLHGGTFELFMRAILCNWLVCLAFFVPMMMKSDMAKVFTMLFLVYCFFISGYEHSIANLSLMSIAYVLEPGVVTITSIIHNLIPVIIGNIIGGAFFMGFGYYILNKE